MTLTRVGKLLPDITRFSDRCFSSSKFLQSSSIDANFETAKQRLNSLGNEPGNETKLKVYALFKQGTIGKNTTSKPGALNFVGQVKWSAWTDLGDMTTDEAKQEYVNLVDELAKAEDDSGSSVDGKQNEDTDAKSYCSGDILVKIENKAMTVALNRPEKYNALTREMYEAIIDIFSKAAKDDSVSILVLTGTGKYYCSGNDLTNFANINPADLKTVAIESADLLRRYVSAFIDFPKPLIAAVNGPSVGIPVTQLGLFDAVFATDEATFQTPFSKIGQSPEACSSYIFPKIMGHARASSLLLFNEKLSAADAARSNLVTKVFSNSTFRDDVNQEVAEMVKLPLKSLVYSKQLMRDRERDILHKVNLEECERLTERWTSDDCIKAIMGFLSSKS